MFVAIRRRRKIIVPRRTSLWHACTRGAVCCAATMFDNPAATIRSVFQLLSRRSRHNIHSTRRYTTTKSFCFLVFSQRLVANERANESVRQSIARSPTRESATTTTVSGRLVRDLGPRAPETTTTNARTKQHVPPSNWHARHRRSKKRGRHRTDSSPRTTHHRRRRPPRRAQRSRRCGFQAFDPPTRSVLFPAQGAKRCVQPLQNRFCEGLAPF